MTAVAAKTVEVQASYSARRFSLTGSMIDQSVVGAIEKAGGYWEPQIMNLMAQTIRTDDVCLDIGANVGVHTLVMAHLASNGSVHSFEPSSVNFAFLQGNIAANSLTNVTAHQVGLGDTVEDRNFYYLSDFAACSFAEDKTRADTPESIIQSAWNAPFHYVTEKVAFTTLDQWSRRVEIKRIDLIKLDAEGSELAVIRGGGETLARFNPSLITELNVNAFRHYFREEPEAYFNLLAKHFSKISIIHEDGQRTPVRHYADLSPHLTAARWWADLFCTNR